MSIMKPFVNNNGTARSELVSMRLDIMDTINATMANMQRIAPHGRDYQGAPEDQYQKDLAVYRARFALLDKLKNEIQEEALLIHNGD
jgi:hypothetical protein